MIVCFLSYRRLDVPDVVGRLHDRIQYRYGPDSVFRDVDSLALGADFRAGLESALTRSHVLLAIIGPRFLQRANPGEPDYVIEEIGRALERELPVIPVLVHDTAMPAEAELPERIAALAFRQAARVRSDPDFGPDVDKLLRVLDALQPVQGGADAPATITLVSGPRQGASFAIRKERTLIGRDPSCDIALESKIASKYHAALLSTHSGLFCEDLGSSNGTFVNGNRCQDRVPLRDGDLVQIGNSILRVQLTGASHAQPIRVAVHIAQFMQTGTHCCFINIVNLSPTAREVTHVWIESTPHAYPFNEDRPLPKRLEPHESWETWIPLSELPPAVRDEPYTLARARLSTGEVVSSVRGYPPDVGFVPGGPINHMS